MMNKREFGIKSGAITALEERFKFQNSVVEEIEKTKMRIAHPGWVELIASHPTPEIPELNTAKPLVAGIKKPETGIMKMDIPVAMQEFWERGRIVKTRRFHKTVAAGDWKTK